MKKELVKKEFLKLKLKDLRYHELRLLLSLTRSEICFCISCKFYLPSDEEFRKLL